MTRRCPASRPCATRCRRWAAPTPSRPSVVRQVAPQAYRTQERAVTEADYADGRRPAARGAAAAAQLRWTGSWYTAFVTVDREGGGSPDDDGLAGEIDELLDAYRMAGVDVEIDAPVPVPVDLALDVCVARRPRRDAGGGGRARRARRRAQARRAPRASSTPTDFTFGQPLYLSQVYAAVLAVPGCRLGAGHDVPSLRPARRRRAGRGGAGRAGAGGRPAERRPERARAAGG